MQDLERSEGAQQSGCLVMKGLTADNNGGGGRRMLDITNNNSGGPGQTITNNNQVGSPAAPPSWRQLSQWLSFCPCTLGILHNAQSCQAFNNDIGSFSNWREQLAGESCGC